MDLLDFPRLFTRLFALIFCRFRFFPYHSAAPFPFPTHLTIFTVVHPLLTWRWLGTNVGTSISPSYVLLSALAPPGLVRITILYILQFMELRQGLRGHFRQLSIFSRLAHGGLRFSDFRLTFAPFSSIFRLSLYTHVRTSSSWSRRCVCSIVSQGAPAGRCTLGNPRATFEFQLCE